MEARDYISYKIGRGLYLYLSPLLLVVGLFGNVLSFVVLSKRATQSPPTYLYLSVLAIVDIFALYLPGLRGWLFYLVDVDLKIIMGCSWYFLVFFTIGNISVYIIVNMTIDRFIYVYFPYAANRICTVKRAIWGIAFVSFVQLAFNLHYPWTLKVDTSIVIHFNSTVQDNQTINTSIITKTHKCVAPHGLENWAYVVWPFLDFTLYSFFPFVLLVILNTLIVYKTIKQRRLVGGTTSAGQKSKHKTTAMLVLVCVFLLLTTTPIVALHIAESFWDRSDPYQEAVHLLTLAICDHLMYFNNTFNFVLYFLSAKKFRGDLKRMLKLNGPQVVPETQESGQRGST